MAVTLAKSLAKIAVGTGALYVTTEQGVWSTDTTQGSKVLHNIRSSVLPTASEYIAKIPSAEQASVFVTSTWNRGVTTLFGGVAEVPECGRKAYLSAKDYLYHDK